MLVHLLSKRTFKSHCFTYPLRAFAGALREQGISVKIFFDEHNALLECDVLCIVGDHFAGGSAVAHHELVARLEQYRPQLSGLVWCDVTDSTGTTAFHILPSVDLYLKNQLLHNRADYTRHFYGMRCYTDYYHRLLGIRDESEDRRLVASPDDLEKLAVSWNIGLGDYTSFGRVGRRVRIFWPWIHYDGTTHSRADGSRDLDVSYRASTRYKRATVTYQREELRNRLRELASGKQYKIVSDGRLSYRDYRAELDRSRVIPSPFGQGEICFRDFEGFLSGGVVFKPTMDHLETWPDYFVPESTYVPFEWDFSDFEEKLSELLDSPERCLSLAQAGQDFYLASRSPAFGDLFAQRFVSLMRSAMDRRMATQLVGQASTGERNAALQRAEHPAAAPRP